MEPDYSPSTILSPTPTAQRSGFLYDNPNQSVVSTQSQGQLGTQMDEKGIITVNLIVDDPRIPFTAVRDTVRFLQSLYPGWSTPAFIGGVAIPNEVGATYCLEKQERKMLDSYDGAQEEITIRRKLTIYIRAILDEATVKRINFEVKCKVISDVYEDPFAPTTFITAEIVPFRAERGKFHFTIKFDGGPTEVTGGGCCCFGDHAARRAEEDAQELKPRIYQQADSVIRYVKHFNPNDPVARQVANHNQMFRSSFEDESLAGTHSKLSGNSGRSPKLVQMGRSNSKDMYQQSMISSNHTGTESAADELSKFHKLLQSGAITQREYEHEKARLLGGSTAQSTVINTPPNRAPPTVYPDNFF